ncbi:MAG: L-threonylcarbamoyladenylate synthase [Candidatus Thermoplasmatota archaeon]|nr:L-threonylcarbamoyladenylate synthase [Candidatus Thermoplasmatota archaeon]
MDFLIYDCREKMLREEEVQEIVDIIKKGGVLVYPTETLYGIGGDPTNKKVFARVCSIKNRPLEGNISIAFSSIDQVKRWIELSPLALSILQKCAPGPVTLLVPRPEHLSLSIPPSPFIGIRMPRHPLALRIIEAAGPILSTSANRHGFAPDEQEALRVGEECDVVILAKGVEGIGSTVLCVDEDAKRAMVIRKGGLDPELYMGDD